MARVSRGQALSKLEFHDRLRVWLENTDDAVVGPDGADGRTGWIYVRDGLDMFVLHSDTRRDAISRYLSLVARFGEDLPWEIAQSQRGKMTAVVYGPEKIRLRSFYMYAAGAA